MHVYVKWDTQDIFFLFNFHELINDCFLYTSWLLAFLTHDVLLQQNLHSTTVISVIIIIQLN